MKTCFYKLYKYNIFIYKNKNIENEIIEQRRLECL